jgi:DNA-binding transcriptional LysR family regulator
MIAVHVIGVADTYLQCKKSGYGSEAGHSRRGAGVAFLYLIPTSNSAKARPGIRIEDLRKAEFVTLHRRRELGHAPRALEDVSKLIIHEAVRVSELLEIPTVVANSDLLGIFLSSMGPLMEERLGLRVLPIPLELPPMPIYMIWHETRRHDAAHSWLREVVAAELARLAGS